MVKKLKICEDIVKKESRYKFDGKDTEERAVKSVSFSMRNGVTQATFIR